MLSLGPITFAAPWALAALAALPALWWLLRMSPPAPRRVRFPPLRFLVALASREETAARTPWWLLLLRLALVVAIIIACAQPLLNAQGGIAGSGPLVLIVDDGWAAAHDWKGRRSAMAALVERAGRADRPVVLVTTAPESAEAALPALRELAAAEAQSLVEAMQPKPWPTQRAAALAALDRFVRQKAMPTIGEIWWFSDGLEEESGAGTAALAGRLQRLAPLTVVAPEPAAGPLLLRPPDVASDGLSLTVRRADAATERTVSVLAISEAGLVIARENARFAPGDTRATVHFRLPAEIAERVGRFELEAERSAGGVVLADARWQRRPVGLVAEDGDTGEPPLLSQLYYLDRALAGFAEVRRGDPSTLLARNLAVLVLPDGARLDAQATERIERWVEAGGTLIRFAGPRLADHADADDPLLPTRLRMGDRSIGGALSWQKPATLAPFEAASPFAGLEPRADVVVHRQVLAEPSFDADQHVWARLDDGTPLVSARKKGAGWLVLFHTTANADWSNLPLSGLFVDMLQRLVALSRGVASADGAGPALAPIETLDGSGGLSAPEPGVRAIEAASFAETPVSPRHPPGLYGNGGERRALNIGAGLAELRPLAPMPAGVARRAFGEAAERDLRGWLLSAALALALLDLALSVALRGLLGRPALREVEGRPPERARRRRSDRAGARAAILAFALGAFCAHPAGAETIIADGSAEPAALTTRLAFIATGDREADAVSRAGLDTLAVMVNRRTAAELGPTAAVDPAVDELAFYPLLYWSIGANAPDLGDTAVRRLVDYMHNGGTILFDLRDDAGGRSPALRTLARRLDIPPLVPLPADHVLRRAYYLLSDLPGRRSGDTVWVVDRADRINDGVTPVIAGSNDWAGAWAADQALRPMFPVVPGGEDQRELAYRFGINLVMHVLTGNYKADQVHLQAIMERLGQ
ncbi:MAG: DUF4159 domain-containing protein [Rhodospirillales bacterium]|nr:DUF4159 domain-containing protein [Rhodospirillales bacterium]